MKPKKILPFLLILIQLAAFVGQAQTVQDYSAPLKSEGPMPADFKKALQNDKAPSDYSVFLKKLIMDGRLLYGTPLNDYLDAIADNLLKDNPVLRSKIHIYILKTPIVNASSTTNGLIIVNMGLIAQVSNESELAFIIAHEIAHVAENHITEINEYKDKLKERDMISYYVKSQNRSREQELAADRIALERYFQSSKYSYDVINGIFDVLQYADLPFDEVPFTKKYTETNFYHFPENYYLTNIAPIQNRADMIDTLFTHPNIEKRRAAAQSIIAGLAKSGRSVYLQPEEKFQTIRNLARLECINILLTDHQYDQTIYNIHVLQQSFPDNAFLQKAMAEAWYGYSKHRNNGQVSDVILSYKKVEGEMQQTSYILSKLNRVEASLLALRYVWAARQRFPENTQITEMANDLLRDVVIKNKMKYTDFSDYPMGTHPDSIVVEEAPAPDSTIGKYARIRRQNQPNKVIPTAKFKTANYMLVDIHQDSDFVSAMNNVIRVAEDEKVLDIVTKKTPADIKTLLIASPEYSFYNKNASSKQVERGKKQLLRTTQTCARRLKLQTLHYAPKQVCAFSTDEYNGYVQLQQWLRDYTKGGGIEMVHHTAQNMAAAYELTGTSKICFVGNNTTSGRFFGLEKSKSLFLTLLCPYVLPVTLTTFVLPRNTTEMYFIITDFGNGKNDVTARDSQTSSINRAYTNAFIYDQLYHFVKGK